MEIITRQSKANTAFDRWRKVYQVPKWVGTNKEDITNKLCALGHEPDPDEVDAIIGNSSWTNLTACDECKTVGHSILVGLGIDHEYSCHAVVLCHSCLCKALTRWCAEGAKT